jgi:tellurite resistance protein TerC
MERWWSQEKWTHYDVFMISCVIAMLVLFDVILAPKISYNMRNHALILAFMISVAALFCSFIWTHHGDAAGFAWLTGYLMEWAMSVDNLFGLQLVFATFTGIPGSQRVRAVTIGTYFAMGFRMCFYLSLAELFQVTHGCTVVIGGFLILSGLSAAVFSGGDDTEDGTSCITGFFKWLLGSRLQEGFTEQGELFTRGHDGKLQMTMLFLVACVVAGVDCVFSIDNASSETGELRCVFINVTSCLLAMYALRTLFFIVRDANDYFEYAPIGVCGILMFVGGQMIASKFGYPLQLKWVLLVILGIFLTSVAASVVKQVFNPRVVTTKRKGVQDLTPLQSPKMAISRDGK